MARNVLLLVDGDTLLKLDNVMEEIYDLLVKQIWSPEEFDRVRGLVTHWKKCGYALCDGTVIYGKYAVVLV